MVGGGGGGHDLLAAYDVIPTHACLARLQNIFVGLTQGRLQAQLKGS